MPTFEASTEPAASALRIAERHKSLAQLQAHLAYSRTAPSAANPWR